jgi:hypothetical protein
MEIKYNDKMLALNGGLTVALGNLNGTFYDQFKQENMFGVNFSWGQWFEPIYYTDLKVFVIDAKLFSRDTLGYFGDCVRLKKRDNKLSGILFAGVQQEEYFNLLTILLNELKSHLSDIDLLIFNNVDQKLSPSDKLIWLRVVNNLAKLKPVFMVTRDFASLRLSNVKFEIVDETNEIEEFYNLLEAIQTDNFESYVQNKIKKENATNSSKKKRISKKKI